MSHGDLCQGSHIPRSRSPVVPIRGLVLLEHGHRAEGIANSNLLGDASHHIDEVDFGREISSQEGLQLILGTNRQEYSKNGFGGVLELESSITGLGTMARPTRRAEWRPFAYAGDSHSTLDTSKSRIFCVGVR